MRRVLQISLLAATLAVLSACTPQTAAERAYFEQKDAAKRDARELKIKLTDAAMPDNEVISIVSSNPAPDNVGTTDDWLKRQIGSTGGQVLFPRWKVLRHGVTDFEVQYAFSVIDEQNRIIKRGYRWQLDSVTKLVGKPRDLVFSGQQTLATTPVPDSKLQTRVATEEASLE